ncbi:hypothetical protein BD310DRAFT_919914 [Dichomitus squalens]|uniref:Uncharacterized protein n=1 Tax=Dichomitus squalens TaxID=114155 RepID=A0A4V2K8Y6_9APHY|nr:hypothetical protein BD310DRAFT_919914 [Dichomitus squalens]
MATRYDTATNRNRGMDRDHSGNSWFWWDTDGMNLSCHWHAYHAAVELPGSEPLTQQGGRRFRHST